MTDIERARQNLFDLMGSNRIKLILEGEMGEVDATLEVGIGKNSYRVFESIGVETWEDALIELMEKYRRNGL